MVEIFVVAFIWVFLAQLFGGASQSASSTNSSDDESSASAFDDEDDYISSAALSLSSNDLFENSSLDDSISINPANGFLMVGGIGGLDIAGNAYGTDSSHWDDHSMSSSSFMNDSYTSSSFDDSFSSSSSMFENSHSSSSFDDSFSSSSYSSFDD